MTPVDGAALLAAVERSPQAAAARDRAAWVGLFTADGRIEDPVGSRPHVGHAQIGRFYDTFIGPRDIEFHRDLDIVSVPVVLRDLELEVAMGPAVLGADGAAITKMNGAGSTVAVWLNSRHGRAIMFADVAWRGNTINRIRYFPA